MGVQKCLEASDVCEAFPPRPRTRPPPKGQDSRAPAPPLRPRPPGGHEAAPPDRTSGGSGVTCRIPQLSQALRSVRP